MEQLKTTVLTRLTSSSGWSDWVFFFFPNQLVMIESRFFATLKATLYMHFGALGVLVQQKLNDRANAKLN